jgi:hypothetical protein
MSVFTKAKAERPSLFSDPSFAKEAATLRRIQAEHDALRQEYGDIHHARCQRQQQAQPDAIAPDVAAILADDDSAVAVADESAERMTAIQRKMEAIEKAIRIQNDRVMAERQRAERELRAKVKAEHQELAQRKLKHRQEGRKLYFECLSFENRLLADCGFGSPLIDLLDASDHLQYDAVDSGGENDNSRNLERAIESYVKE